MDSQSFLCPKCDVVITDMSRYLHLAAIHQMKTTIRFTGRGEQNIKIERSSETGHFHCPRCPSSFSNPKLLQQHALKLCSSLRRNGSVEVAHSFKTKATKRRSFLRGSPTLGLALMRAEEPRLSRTHRAIARQMYAQESYTNKEIAEFLNCEPRDVYYAIHNACNDNIDQDALYLNGVRGELINVDRCQGPEEVVLKEENMEDMNVDGKLEVDNFIPDSDDSHASELEIETYYMHSPRSSDLESPPASPRSLRAQRNRILPNLSDRPQSLPLPSALPSEPSTVPKNVFLANNNETWAFRMSSSAYSTSIGQHTPIIINSTSPSLYSGLSHDPIEAFLFSLKRPCVHLASAFRAYGLLSAEDLDALCRMQEYWNEVGQYLLRQGLTPFEWLMVQEGLRARAARLSAVE